MEVFEGTVMEQTLQGNGGSGEARAHRRCLCEKGRERVLREESAIVKPRGFFNATREEISAAEKKKGSKVAALFADLVSSRSR